MSGAETTGAPVLRPLEPGMHCMVGSGPFLWRKGIFRGWTHQANGGPLYAEVDLFPTERAKARHVRVATLFHTRQPVLADPETAA